MEGENVNTLKTAVVVIVLLGAGYGVWMVISNQATPATMPAEVAAAAQSLLAPPQCDMGVPGSAAPAPGVFPADDASELPPHIASHFVNARGEPGSASAPYSPTRQRPDPRGIDPGTDSPDAPHRDPFPTPGVIPGSQLGIPSEVTSNSPDGMPPRSNNAVVAAPAAQMDGGYAERGRHESIPDQRPDTTGGPGVSPVVALASGAFDSDWQFALRQLEQGELANALETLTVWHGSPDLSAEEEARVQQLLDQLAGTVIYSRQHLIRHAHVVKVHERLEDIADQYHVPVQLLANINGITNPDTILPGQRLKVVPGPFTARVDTQRQQIVMYARSYYAGRLFFTPGSDQPPRAGDYEVITKVIERTWYDRNGREVPPEHPENPYGPFWIGLGSDQCIHGLASEMARGCIGLTPRDAQDLYAILSVGSQVKIR
jgi:hypothetical protein